MPSDLATPQPGNPPKDRTGEGTAPKTDPAPASPVMSVLQSNAPALDSPEPAKTEPGQQSNPLPPRVGPGDKSASESLTPGVQSHSAGDVASQPSQGAELKPLILLQMPSGAVVVDMKRDHLRDFGVLVPGIVSIVVTVIIAILAQQINKQQARSLAAQSDAAQEEVNVKFIEEFKKHLGELTLPVEQENQENLTKKTLAAITLAQYGERALPALKMSLAVEDEGIRNGAVVVVVQMLSNNALRGIVLSRLGEYFNEHNASLRVGVLDCYLTIDRGLTEKEFNDANNKIRQYVTPSTNYLDRPQEQRVLLWATKFFSNWPSRDSRDFLLAVAKNRTCGNDPREGAINYLPAVTMGAKYLLEEEREASKREVTEQLRELLADAPERLQKNIIDAMGKLQGTEGMK